ncbi:MAG TPA: LLM class flavin-dependent oxidoreductase [Acidimicrobiia bacterium]|nr:LLM class flavin-dependent oxidoreductase [Acidimicrobiia bacterium]
MRIGVGLPTSTPPVGGRHRGPELLAWATRVEAGPFASLGVTDRLVYDCTDPMVALAAAAAVTTRLRLVTMVVIGPIRPAAVLAAQAASLDALSGGRVTLGVSLGARPDDYDAAGAQWRDRGRQLSDELAAMRDIWEGTTVGPRPASPGGPDLLVGGGSGAAFLRAARLADGYVHGGGPPRAFAAAAGRARAAWADAGRPGEPQLWGQSYFSLADPDAGAAYLRHYYAFTGPFAGRVAAGLLDSGKALREQVAGYAESGCDELVLLPATSDPSELDRLADALS